jgi:mono/diheme cytochrome c family protein
MKKQSIYILLILLILSTTDVLAQDPPSTSEGQMLWSENCAPCHGKIGMGDGPTAASIPNPVAKLADPAVAREAVPADYFDTIRNGRMDKMMPPWKSRLSEQQIWDVTAYALSLSVSTQDLLEGKILYTQSCASCHGDNGTATSDVPDFADWPTMAKKSQANLQANFAISSEHDKLSGLSDEQLWQLLAYIRTFSFIVPSMDGVLRGQIINATTDQPVSGVEVQLHLLQDNAEIETRTAQADDEGNYIFEQLPRDTLTEYMTEAEYQGVFYISQEAVNLTADNSETTLDLKVYDTTTYDPGIYITQLHYFISLGPEDIRIDQIFVLGNRGTETYLGQDGQTFAFALPAVAEEISFFNDATGKRFLKTETGYVDTEPIIPGEEGASIVVTYFVPHDGQGASLEIPIPTEVAKVTALMEDKGATLTSNRLQFSRNRQIQGKEFMLFSGQDIEADDTLVMQLADLDKISFEQSPATNTATSTNTMLDQTTLLGIVLGVGCLAIILVVVVYPTVRPQPEDTVARRQKLIQMLACLDEKFDAGEFEETVYRQARTRYKKELIKVIESE